MEKYIVRIVEPENQSSQEYLDGCDFLSDNIIITSDRFDVWSDMEDLVDRIIDLIDNEEIEDFIAQGYESKSEMLNDKLDVNCFTEEDIYNLENIISDQLIYIMNTITKNHWKSGVIKGSVPRDYQKVIYNADVINDEALDLYEAMWFNTGIEFMIIDNDINETWNDYAPYMSDDELIEKAADEIGCKPKEITLEKPTTKNYYYDYEKITYKGEK